MCVFCYCLFGTAQNDTLKGRINDTMGNPVPLVHVMVLQAGTFVLGTITDENGSFVMENLKHGTYSLEIAGMGYADLVREFAHQETTTDLGVLQLSPASIELEGVELVGGKKLYQRRANSLVINVEQSIAGSGGSALELLGNTAGVSINQQNGTLSLSGKGQVAIMVNGKLSRVDGQALLSRLKSMPASDIKNLEIFNNPPSRYEANGSGGMIHITTRSNDGNGQGGSVSLTSGYGKGEKTAASSNFHYQNGDLGLFGSYSFNRNSSPEEWALQSGVDKSIEPKSGGCEQPSKACHRFTQLQPGNGIHHRQYNKCGGISERL